MSVVGAAGWATRAPVRGVAWLGIALASVSGVLLIIGDSIRFGFDDVRALFAQAAVWTPAACAVACLLTAGVRSLLSNQRRGRKAP